MQRQTTSGKMKSRIEQKIFMDLIIGVAFILLVIFFVCRLDLCHHATRYWGQEGFSSIAMPLTISASGIYLLGIMLVRRVEELGHIILSHFTMEKRLYRAHKMESVARLSMGITHDFNNLLGIIVGYSDIALETSGLNSEMRDHLAQIKMSGQRAGVLARRLLDLGSGRTEEKNETFLNLNDLIYDMQPLLKHLVGKQVSLSMDLSADISMVKVDQTQLEEVLINMILNAHDAMPGGGEMTISTFVETFSEKKGPRFKNKMEGRYIRLSISDTGVGIDDKTKSRIFDPFFSTKSKGTGLGLPMVAGIVEGNGGYISVRSKLGRGTVFDIYLPVMERIVNNCSDDEANKIKEDVK